MNELTVSIVIATADRPAMVLDCLRKLVEIGVPAEVEVIIVDAGNDQVDEAAATGIWRRTRMIRCPVRNAALQRNEGIRRATGEIIILLDDDTYVQPGWWPAIVEPLCCGRLETSDSRHQAVAHRCVGVVAGAVWCNPSPSFTDERGGYINWRGEPIQITHRSANAPRNVDWPMTTNMAVTKDAFMAVGGFCEAYGIYDEDVDFGLKIRRAGFGISFAPEAAVYHYFMLRPPKPMTKSIRFRDGRNRAMLIVRNYGFSPRLVLFLLSSPIIQLWAGAVRVTRSVAQAACHYVAYVAGMMMGLIDGVRHPVRDDCRRYEERSGSRFEE